MKKLEIVMGKQGIMTNMDFVEIDIMLRHTDNRNYSLESSGFLNQDKCIYYNLKIDSTFKQILAFLSKLNTEGYYVQKMVFGGDYNQGGKGK